MSTSHLYLIRVLSRLLKVFYGLLARALGEGRVDGAEGPSTGPSTGVGPGPGHGPGVGVGATTGVDASTGSRSEGGGSEGGGGRERGLSSLSDPFPGASTLTLASFYAAVADQYYHLEPTIHRINFELNDAQVSPI